MIVLLGLLLILSFSQVAGRLFFNIGFKEGDSLIYHLVLWSGLWGAILATRYKEHISIDVVSRFTSGRLKHGIQAMTNLFSAAVCGVLLYASIRFIRDEFMFNDTAIAGLPLWIYQLIIPFAFLSMGLRFLLYSFQACRTQPADGVEEA